MARSAHATLGPNCSRDRRMDSLRNWASQWGDLASIAGLGLTIVGFVVTIVGVRRSRAAAEAARLAAEATQASIAQYDAIADLSAAAAIMDEIKRLQRHGAWGVLPDRYGELRRRLVALKGSAAQLTEAHRQVFQSAIETFADLERRVERAASAAVPPPNPAKLNDIVSGQIDALHAVLLAMQRLLRSQQ